MDKLVYSVDKVTKHLYVGLSPSYDEKRNTNKVLSIYATMLKQELKDKIYELKEQDNKHY